MSDREKLYRPSCLDSPVYEPKSGTDRSQDTFDFVHIYTLAIEKQLAEEKEKTIDRVARWKAHVEVTDLEGKLSEALDANRRANELIGDQANKNDQDLGRIAEQLAIAKALLSGYEHYTDCVWCTGDGALPVEGHEKDCKLKAFLDQ